MLTKALLAFFFVILALDFRGQVAGGGWFQYFVVGSTCGLGIIMLLTNLRLLAGFTKPQKRITYGFFWLVLSSILVFFKNALVLDRYMRVFVPVLLAAFAFFAVTAAARKLKDVGTILRVLVFSAMLSAIWRFYYGSNVIGVSLDVMRYQIISQGTAFLLSYSFYKAIFSERYRFWWSLILAGVSGVMLLSITRTHLFSLVVLALASFWILFKLKDARHLANLRVRFLMSAGIISAAVCFVVVPAVLYFRPDVLDIWKMRLLESKGASAAIDPTSGMRIAQISGQLNEFKRHPEDIILGRGFGNTFKINLDFLLSYATTSQIKDEDMATLGSENWQNADSVYIPALFNGGLFFVALIFYMAQSAIRPLVKFDFIARDRYIFDLYGGVVFGVINFMAIGIFGNFLLDRYGGALFAALVALALALVRISAEPRPNIDEVRKVRQDRPILGNR